MFFKRAKERAAHGRKKYEKSDGLWDSWGLERFIDEAEEELLDAYNYLEELRCKINGSKSAQTKKKRAR